MEVSGIAFNCAKKTACLTSLDEKKLAIFAPQLLSNVIHQTSLLNMGKTARCCFFMGLNPSHAEIEAAKRHAEEADVLLVCSYNAWKNPSQIALIHVFMDTGKPLILVVTRDPLDNALFPAAALTFTTFSPTAVSLEAVCNRLVPTCR